MVKPLQSKEKIKTVGEFYKEIEEGAKEHFHFWQEHTLFHWDFWLSVFFTITPIIFWIKFRNKRSSNRLLFAGLSVFIISSWFDLVGVQFGKWYYTGKVLPTIPSFLPWDLVLLPILAMTLIQIRPNMSAVLKGLIFAGVSTFVGEPLFLWLGFYVIVDWNIFYSFPLYFVIYLIAHRLSKVSNFDPIK